MANGFIQASYFAVAVVFILGLKAMSSPVTARKGIVWAGYAMVAATVVTFFTPELNNVGLMVLAIVSGGAVAWWRRQTQGGSPAGCRCGLPNGAVLRLGCFK